MNLALDMAKMAKGGFSCTAIEEMQHVIKIPQAKVREQKKLGDEFPGNKYLNASKLRYPAVLREHQHAGCLPGQNGTVLDSQTRWRHQGLCAPPPHRVRQPTPDTTPRPPGTPSLPTGDNEGAPSSEIEGVPPGYVYIHHPLPCTQLFYHDVFIKDCLCDIDFNPDLPTDEDLSTG